MNTISVKPNQSMLDIIITACGSLEGGMQLVQANNVSISDIPLPGQNIAIPAGINTDTAALQYLQQNSVVLGTANN